MIFDEVDQGVGGAVADAVGLRLKRLAAERAPRFWSSPTQPRSPPGPTPTGGSPSPATTPATRTRVEPLSPAERQEEIARMLSGAEVTEAARAAAGR
jgi:DNA repair protein RecN (Recombination protein N)